MFEYECFFTEVQLTYSITSVSDVQYKDYTTVYITQRSSQ